MNRDIFGWKKYLKKKRLFLQHVNTYRSILDWYLNVHEQSNSIDFLFPSPIKSNFSRLKVVKKNYVLSENVVQDRSCSRKIWANMQSANLNPQKTLSLYSIQKETGRIIYSTESNEKYALAICLSLVIFCLTETKHLLFELLALVSIAPEKKDLNKERSTMRNISWNVSDEPNPSNWHSPHVVIIIINVWLSWCKYVDFHPKNPSNLSLSVDSKNPNHMIPLTK